MLLTVAMVGLAGCGSPQERARVSADELAARAHNDIDPRSNQAVPAELVARRAIEHHLEVVQVEGVDTAATEGVSLTIRLVAYGADSDFWPTDFTEYTFCYVLWFHRHEERKPDRVTCP
ncbi:hypothetical protein Rhe02_58420 [Rhizocola hellebori]|uniref:Uncharacterized protein n=1 Tax=Rhizocola hellebori TaxID=1392758 RepID=A0A8J3QDS8_9ACTN|nr:hypothetical protein Rhe02_58420 [Rhizocola hellebori]